MCVKETVRLYKNEACANHGVGALKRFGWEVRDKPKKVELSGVEVIKHLGKAELAKLPKGALASSRIVWEVRAVRGLSILIRLYDAYMAAKRAALQVLKSA